jgi:crotonobetainyl-CoA:carnitine CoA-transferase CaiB-like acyl-CoA transferase
MEILDRFDIPAAPVNDLAGVFSDPQVRARGMVKSYQHSTLGEVRHPPSPIKLSDWEPPDLPAPMLGEHTVEVLQSRLGLARAEVDRLLAAGVVKAWNPAGSD